MTFAQGLLTLHILFASLWFAYPLGQSRAMRKAFESRQSPPKNIVEEVLRRSKTAFFMGVLTLATGLWLASLYDVLRGPFSAYHASLLTVLTMLVLTFAGLVRIAGNLSTEGESTGAWPERAGHKIRRYGMISGIIHLGWVVVLLLMVIT